MATIFEKLGLDPQGGIQIFQILCNAVAKMNGSYLEGQPSEDGPGCEERDTFSERDTKSTKSAPSPPAPTASSHAPNAALASALGGMAVGSSTPQPPSAPISESSPVMSCAKMDVRDFIRACEIDDSLIQVLLYRPRARLSHLCRLTQVAEEDTCTSNQSSLPRRRSASIALEREFIKAMQLSEQEKTSFPIAKAVGRATLYAAFGLAAKVTQGAQQLMEITYEGMEGGDEDVMYTADDNDA